MSVVAGRRTATWPAMNRPSSYCADSSTSTSSAPSRRRPLLAIETAFADLTPKQRNRMATTLLVWLQTRGTHREIAARLDVHPQTVRYRIHQLQQLFGDKLTDPDTRLTMELALRAHLLLTPPTPG